MSKNKKNILLLEDDDNLAFILAEHLEMNGFTVTRCQNGVEGLSTFRKSSFVLILADVMMPKMDGFTFIKEIRRLDQQMPVIFLTAKSMKEDRIEGLKIGADDYITKPFSMEELLLRIIAVLKRTNGHPRSEAAVTVFTIGKFHFDVRRAELKLGDKKKISLTTKEAELLSMLCANINAVVEREQILNAIWNSNSIYTARSMDVYISKLRKYLSADPSISIANVHGKGYKLLVDA